MIDVLIVEDQAPVAAALETLFEVEGIRCLVAQEPRDALDRLESEQVGLVVQDMNFSAGATGGAEGVALFREVRRRHPGVPVVLVTAWTSLETAVELVKEGAADYLAKPWDDEKLLATVRNLLHLRRLERENQRLRGSIDRARAELAERHDLAGIVYESRVMHDLVLMALRVAPADVPVLVTGPSGAGKERIADLVHSNSRRRQGPFVKVNAGALPDGLLEAELFGAEPGAYTGLVRRRTGRFETADRGTLFLDEIGNLSPGGQAGLLRVLQSGEFERLGSSATHRVDVRLIAATNADLPAEIAAGRFREDLYFRLRVVELAIPPLAERPEDVLVLARHFLAAAEPPPGRTGWTLPPAVAARLRTYPWPGNVRELANAVQRATLIARDEQLRFEDFGLTGTPASMEKSQRLRRPEPRTGTAERPAESADDARERAAIEQALRESDGVVARAAQRLGLSRQALYRRMDKHGIRLERRLEG
jgi:DNA-binding NtrC family response regulator